MGKPSRSRAEKKKRREKELRRRRNLQRNEPTAWDAPDYADFDRATAIEMLPGEVHVERVGRRIARATGVRRFANLQDVEAALGTLTDEGRAKLTAEDPRETALDLAFLAAQEENEDFAPDLLDEALELDPECADALALQAVSESDDVEHELRGLERALSTASRALDDLDVATVQAGNLFDDVFARSYMRVRKMLANVLFSHDRFVEATGHLEALIALDERDPLAVRVMLASTLLALGNVERAREMLDRLSERDLVVAGWARPLELWLMGDIAGADRALQEARDLNDLAEARILDPVSLADVELDVLEEELEDPDYAYDATVTGLLMGQAWRAHPGAFAWLREKQIDPFAEDALQEGDPY